MTIRLVAALFVTVLTLPACGGSNSTNPPPASPSNISGDYVGVVHDSAAGTLAATATLAQHGSSAGGTLSTTAGSTTLNSALTLVISSSNALNGTIVQDLPSGVTCSFSTNGSYDTSGQQITGSYSAVTGCSGQSGTYTLIQQCTDTITAAGGRRRLGVPKC